MPPTDVNQLGGGGGDQGRCEQRSEVGRVRVGGGGGGGSGKM